MRIAELEESIKALEEESMRSEVYSDASKITRVMEEKRKKEDEKAQEEERWLLITEELEIE